MRNTFKDMGLPALEGHGCLGIALESLGLSHEAQERFAVVLLDPPAPTDTLDRAFERHRALISK